MNLGPRIGIKTKEEETRVFQKLLDGGLYVVSDLCKSCFNSQALIIYRTDCQRQAPGSAYHHKTPGWFRVTFSVPPENLEAGLERLEDLLNLHCVNVL